MPDPVDQMNRQAQKLAPTIRKSAAQLVGGPLDGRRILLQPGPARPTITAAAKPIQLIPGETPPDPAEWAKEHGAVLYRLRSTPVHNADPDSLVDYYVYEYEGEA